MTNEARCCTTPFSKGGQEISALYFTKAPGETFLRAYAQYGDDPCWVPLPGNFPTTPDLQQVRDAGRNISLDTASFEDAHFYLRSADGDNMTAGFFTNAAGGGIQVSSAQDYAPLNLQPDGGMLTYGGSEVATVNNSLVRRYETITNFNSVPGPGIYFVGNVTAVTNYPHIGGNNNGASSGYLVMYAQSAVQHFYPTNETATLNRGGGFWYRRTPTDTWEYKCGVLEIWMKGLPVAANDLLITGEYAITGNLAQINAGGYPDSGAASGGIPLMVSVRKRWGGVTNNYIITQEAVSAQESSLNLTRKWIRSCFNWRGNNAWDAWNEVGLLRDVYTKAQLNTDGAGGAVHWNNITNKPTIVSAETDPTVPAYVKAIAATDIDNWNAKENGANKSAAIALGNSNTLFPTQNAVKTYVDTAITNNNASFIPAAQKGAANGVATLNSSGKIPDAQIPAIAITNTSIVTSQAEMLALTAEVGDVAVRTDINKSFILKTAPASTSDNWTELRSPTIANTDQVPEGTINLYFTNARSRNAISGVAPVGYNVATGAISMPQASGSANGYLSAADWSAFNGKEPAFAKNTAFNKNFGTVAGTVTEGNDNRVLNGQTAFSWGNHATAGYLTAVPTFQAVATAGNTYTGDLVLSTGIPGNEMFVGAGPGVQNTRVGQQALAAVTNNTARWNTAIGSNALRVLTSGYNNTAIGEWCMPDWISDSTNIYSNNTAVGDSAMQGATSGISNTVLGAAAGSVLGGPRGRGNYNIMIGQATGTIDASVVPGNGGNYNLFIGTSAGANVAGSNQLRIGTRNTSTGEHIIEGDMSAGTLALNSTLSVKTMNPYSSGGYNYVVWNNTTKRYETINPNFLTTETDPLYTADDNIIAKYRGNYNGTDANTLTRAGWYDNGAGAPTGTNFPVAGSGFLKVTPYSAGAFSAVEQEFVPAVDFQGYLGRKWHRTSWNGVFNGWKEYLFKEDNVLCFKGSIPGSANLNNYTTTGIYHQSLNAQAASGTNYPAPYAGKLEVFTSEYTYQTYHVYKDYDAIYYRALYNGAWSPWKQVRTKADDGELIQQLSLSGNNLSITGGNTVTLPLSQEVEANGYQYGRSIAYNKGWDTRGGIATGLTRYFQNTVIDVAIMPDLHFFICLDDNELRLPDAADWQGRILKFRCRSTNTGALHSIQLTTHPIVEYNQSYNTLYFDKAALVIEIKSSLNPLTGTWVWEIMEGMG